MDEKEETIYASADKYTRYFIRKSVKGGRVAANIRKLDLSKKVEDLLVKYLGGPNKLETIIESIDKYNKLDKKSKTTEKITEELINN